MKKQPRRAAVTNKSNHFFLLTAALKAAPAENWGTVAAAILMAAPVRGFLPVRAARFAALNVPISSIT